MKRAKSEQWNYFEFTHQLADGSLREVEVYSKPIIIDDKELLYSFIYDVTEREKLEDKIAEQKNRYKILFETTGTATFFVEADTTISLVNQEAEILTGYTKEELEGKLNFSDLIAYSEEKKQILSYHRARKEGDEQAPNRYEFSLKDKQGGIKEVLINVKMISQTKQSIISLIDVTENRRQQWKLNQTYSKLSQNLEKAKDLHQRFLPSELPEIDGLSFAAYYQPAEKIGGDFYNYIQLEDKLIFYLVDITGHGLDGAMLNIFVREAINNYIIEVKEMGRSLAPNKVIEYVFKKYKQEKFPADYFISLIIGVLDTNTYQVKISNMGIHILPWLTDQDSNLSTLPVAGLPITNTIVSDFYQAGNIGQKSLQLEPGTTLFLTTDGLVEESRGGERYGEVRLKETVKANNYLPPKLMVANIICNFKEFTGQLTTKDDITFLILQRNVKIEATFSTEIKSNIEAVYQAHIEIKQFIEYYTEEIELILVGTHEILVNAVEHGNKLVNEKKVQIEIKVTKKYIEIIIADEGPGFAWKDKLYTAEGLESSYQLDNLDGRGRGLLIARETLDAIMYNEPGNKVYLYKMLS